MRNRAALEVRNRAALEVRNRAALEVRNRAALEVRNRAALEVRTYLSGDDLLTGDPLASIVGRYLCFASHACYRNRGSV